jgi:MFS family permease
MSEPEVSTGRAARAASAVGSLPVRAGRLIGSEPRLCRFLLAQCISRTGDFLALAALPFAVFSIGGGAGDAGLLLSCQSLSLLAFLLFGGVIADRMSRVGVMVVADLLRLASQATVAALLITGTARLWELVPLMIVCGAGTAFFEPAAGGVLPQLVDERRLASANALRNFALSAAAAIGPLAAGAATVAAGPGWAFALDAASFGLSAALLSGLSDGYGRPGRSEAASLVRDAVRGWREFASRSWLWAVVAQFAVFNALVWAPFLVLGAVVAGMNLGGPGAWGMILALAGAGEMVGCLAALVLRPARPLLIATASVAIWAAPLILLGIAAPLPLVASAVLPAGAALGVFCVTWDTAVQLKVPEDQLSRISSIDALGSLAILPLGYLLAGSAQATIGPRTSLLASAGFVLLSSVAVAAIPSVRALQLEREVTPSGAGACKDTYDEFTGLTPVPDGVA